MFGRYFQDIEGLVEGDKLVCTESLSAEFLVGETYEVQKHEQGYLYVSSKLGTGYRFTTSKFRKDLDLSKYLPNILEGPDRVRVYTPITVTGSPVIEPTDREKGKIASDGGSTDYYKIPEHATELRHLISAKGMSKSRGDIFKACYRLGEKKDVDVLYDLNKMKFFIEDLIEMYHRGEHI